MIHNRHFPAWLALVTALFWGVWWVPIRTLEGVGLQGHWAGVAMSIGAMPIIFILLITNRKSTKTDARVILSGALIGTAFVLYSISISETTVVRAVLLFYLAPAWAIAIECIFMGRKLHVWNAAAFGLAGAGVLLIFRGNVSLSDWGIGDLMAVVSGMCWAAGSALVFLGGDIGARKLTVFGTTASCIIGLLLALTSGHPAPNTTTLTTALPWMLIGGTLYLAPLMITTLWAARRLAPTTMSFLLTAEIISGIATAAWFLDEPFGWPEICGAFLITFAALTEVISAPKSAPVSDQT